MHPRRRTRISVRIRLDLVFASLSLLGIIAIGLFGLAAVPGETPGSTKSNGHSCAAQPGFSVQA